MLISIVSPSIVPSHYIQGYDFLLRASLPSSSRFQLLVVIAECFRLSCVTNFRMFDIMCERETLYLFFGRSRRCFCQTFPLIGRVRPSHHNLFSTCPSLSFFLSFCTQHLRPCTLKPRFPKDFGSPWTTWPRP